MASDRSKVLHQAQQLASRGQYDAAIAEWKKLATDAPNDGSIHNSIGDLHLKRNAGGEATTAFLQAAAAFRAEGATLKAIAAYKKVLKIDPTRYEVYRHLGDLNAERGLLSSAVQDYLTLGKHYLKERKGKEALDIYKKIVSQDPSNLDAQQRVAELCVQENLQDEATKVYLQLGRERSAQGRYDEAKDAYLAVLRIDPKNNEAMQFVESVQKGSTGSFKAVKPASTTGTQKLSEPLDLLAEATRRIEEKQYAGAEAILNQVLTREPGNPQVCQLLARLHLQRGDVRVALGEYRFLAGAALRAQDYALAESLIGEFLAAEPDSVPLIELYGELLEEKGDRAAAAQQYAKAIELLLEHPEAGMESLHEELFEKVKALSSDSALINRLAVRIAGEPVADPESAPSAGSIESAAHEAEPVSAAPIEAIPEPSIIETQHVAEMTPPGLHPEHVPHAPVNGNAVDPAGPLAGITRGQDAGFSLANAAPDGNGPTAPVAAPHEPFEPIEPGVEPVEAVSFTPVDPVDAGHIGPEDAVAGQRVDEQPAPGTPAIDYEAHFTLGVACKNMELYEEAKEEFEIAKGADSFYVDSCLMLALCLKEEKQSVRAIDILEAVLSDPRCQGAKSQAIRYELGRLYEIQAQWEKAALTYQSIPSFHDVAQRLDSLKGRCLPASEFRLAG